MKRIKEFFSPVKGGHNDGYTFKTFMMSFDRIGLFSVLLSAVILFGIFIDPYSFDPRWTYFIPGGFLVMLLGIFTWKGIFQHWNDLKHGRSR